MVRVSIFNAFSFSPFAYGQMVISSFVEGEHLEKDGADTHVWSQKIKSHIVE